MKQNKQNKELEPYTTIRISKDNQKYLLSLGYKNMNEALNTLIAKIKEQQNKIKK